MPTTLAERVIKAREHAKLSQAGLADKIGVTQQTVAAIEAGGGTKQIGKIARACGARAKWLEFDDGPMLALEDMGSDYNDAAAMPDPSAPAPLPYIDDKALLADTAVALQKLYDEYGPPLGLRDLVELSTDLYEQARVEIAAGKAPKAALKTQIVRQRRWLIKRRAESLRPAPSAAP